MANLDKITAEVAGRTSGPLAKRHAAFFILHSACTAIGVDPRAVRELLPEQWKILEVPGTRSSSDLIMIDPDKLVDRRGFDPERWFIRDQELIHANECTYVISNQWGGDLSDLAARLNAVFPQLSVRLS